MRIKRLLFLGLLFVTTVYIPYPYEASAVISQVDEQATDSAKEQLIDFKKEAIDSIISNAVLHEHALYYFAAFSAMLFIMVAVVNAAEAKKQTRLTEKGQETIDSYRKELNMLLQHTAMRTEQIAQAAIQQHNGFTLAGKLNNLVESGKEVFSYSIAKKPYLDILLQGIDSETFATAENALRNGRGAEAVWGCAVLELSKKKWASAYYFWNGFVNYYSQNRFALFCATLTGYNFAWDEKDLEKFKNAEAYAQLFYTSDSSPEALWCLGRLKEKSVSLHAKDEQERLWAEVEQYYRVASVEKPEEISWKIDWAIALKNHAKFLDEITQKEMYIKIKKLFSEAIGAEKCPVKRAEFRYYYGSFLYDLADMILSKTLKDKSEARDCLNQAKEEYIRAIEDGRETDSRPLIALGILELRLISLNNVCERAWRFFDPCKISVNDVINHLHKAIAFDREKSLLPICYAYFIAGKEEKDKKKSKEYADKSKCYLEKYYKVAKEKFYEFDRLEFIKKDEQAEAFMNLCQEYTANPAE